MGVLQTAWDDLLQSMRGVWNHAHVPNRHCDPCIHKNISYAWSTNCPNYYFSNYSASECICIGMFFRLMIMIALHQPNLINIMLGIILYSNVRIVCRYETHDIKNHKKDKNGIHIYKTHTTPLLTKTTTKLQSIVGAITDMAFLMEEPTDLALLKTTQDIKKSSVNDEYCILRSPPMAIFKHKMNIQSNPFQLNDNCHFYTQYPDAMNERTHKVNRLPKQEHTNQIKLIKHQDFNDTTIQEGSKGFDDIYDEFPTVMKELEGYSEDTCEGNRSCNRFQSFQPPLAIDSPQGILKKSEVVIEGEKDVIHEEDRNFQPNVNIENVPYNLDIHKVDKHIKLDTKQMYTKASNQFDDIYADDEDNILLPKHPSVIAHANDNDDECTEEEQGYKEIIGQKTYIFPREYKNIGAVFSYGKEWTEGITPKYKHLKEEVLNNKYAPITEKTWNAILIKCKKIFAGDFLCEKRRRWSRLIRENRIGMKHLVALKLYTDFDLLQREFRKSFRAPYNRTKERLEAFFHWRAALREAFEKFSCISTVKRNQPHRLFCGINSIMCLDQYQGIYYGPCSTTTDLHVARAFAGKNGMILVMKPDLSPSNYRVLDISWISDYPDEREILLFDHRIEIETWILTSDFDEFYHYYHNILAKGKSMNQEPGNHLSYPKQQESPKHLTELKSLIDEVQIKNKKCFKLNVEFSKNGMSDTAKIDLLIWIFEFALKYKFGKKKPSKYDLSLNANLQHVMKRIHIMQVPPKLVIHFMEKLGDKYQQEFSAYFISSVFNEYFLNTYCKLNPSV